MASSAHHGRQIRNEAAMAIVIGKRAMIAMRLTSPDLSPRQTPSCSTAANAQQGECPAVLPVAETAIVTTQFMPLDPGIVSELIPAFFIGRNKEGFWVARDARGRIGGIFPARELRPVVCKEEQPADRMCNHISVREVRARPGKQRQSACSAAWTVDAPDHAPSPANDRLGRQNHETTATLAERSSRHLSWQPRVK